MPNKTNISTFGRIRMKVYRSNKEKIRSNKYDPYGLITKSFGQKAIHISFAERERERGEKEIERVLKILQMIICMSG